MRLLYIINGNGLSSALGGSIVRSANVAKCLAAAGHEVWLLTTSGGLEACRQLGLEVPAFVVRASIFGTCERGIASRLWSYVVSAIHSSVKIRSLPQVDWVYTDSDYPCDIVPAALYRARRGGRWVAMVHHLVNAEAAAASIPGKVKHALQQWAHGFIAKRADRIFTYATDSGDNIAAEMEARGVSANRVKRVHNGYDGAELAAITPAAKRFDACLVGGVRPGKGLYEIVPIWTEVCRHHPAQLAIVGGMLEHNRAYLEVEIEKAGLRDRLTLFGARDHAFAIATLKASSIMFAPSLEEGWGIAACESLACGIPVVAYDLPAYRSLFAHGIQRVAIGDRRAFASAIVASLADQEGRGILSERGRKSVTQYEWATVARRDAELLY